jgi:DNA-directed RNA polymerase sigma subunit (sigma70/sigma32)
MSPSPSELQELIHRAARIASAKAIGRALRADVYEVALSAAGFAAAKYLTEYPTGEKLIEYVGVSAHRAARKDLMRRQREDGIEVIDGQGALPRNQFSDYRHGPKMPLTPDALKTSIDEDALLDRLSLSDVRPYIAVLTPQERRAITARFGLGPEGRLSEEATALMMGLSERRVRQLVSAGLQRMRNAATPPADDAASAA